MRTKLTNPEVYEARRYDEQTFKEVERDALRLDAMKTEAEERISSLEIQLKEMRKAAVKYEDLEKHFRRAKKELKNVLETIGFPLTSNQRQTNQAYEIYEELECYIGLREEVGYGFDPIARIPEKLYKEVDGELVEQDIIEMNQYIRDFGSS